MLICYLTSLLSLESEGRLLGGSNVDTETERMNRIKPGKGTGESLPGKENEQPVQSLKEVGGYDLPDELKVTSSEKTRNPLYIKISKFFNIGTFNQC